MESNLERRLASVYNCLRNLAKNPSSVVSKDPLHDSTFGILEAAKKAVRSCPNLREITIVLHDHALTPLFMSFLYSMWASESIGAQLQKLTIDTTVVKLPLLLNPIIKHSGALLNLVEFDLNIYIYFPYRREPHRVAPCQRSHPFLHHRISIQIDFLFILLYGLV